LLLNLENRFKPKVAQAGFTMIELMFVILILGVLALGAKPVYDSLFGKAKANSTKSSLQIIEGAIEQCKLLAGQYPQHLEDLIIKPSGMSQAQWGGPYLDPKKFTDGTPLDGWKHEFYYKLNPKGSAMPYELYSNGASEDGSDESERITP